MTVTGCEVSRNGSATWSIVKKQCNAETSFCEVKQSKAMYETGKKNAVCANDDIKCPIPQSWKMNISVDMFIEAPMHLLFLGIVKNIMDEI